jgi:hypothetical protein
MANEGGGFLVLGVADKPPRKVVGTQAFQNLNEMKEKMAKDLRQFQTLWRKVPRVHERGRSRQFGPLPVHVEQPRFRGVHQTPSSISRVPNAVN